MTEASPLPTLPKVVVYRSAITDIRTVEARLRRAELPFEVEVVGMASQEERKRYRELKQSSGHGTLPLIFIDERCIGGEPELARYIADRRDHAPEPPEDSTPATVDDDNTQEPASPDPTPEVPEPNPPDTSSADGDEPPTTPAPAGSLDQALATPAQAPAGTAIDASDSALRRRTDLLGYAGLIPFFACAGGSFFGPQQELARLALVAYAAVIFSFVGAVHWGYSLGRDPAAPRGLVASVIPSLIGWAALMLHAQTGATASLALLGVSFLLWHAFERASARLPGHYLGLRLRLTALVSSLLIGSAIAVSLALGQP
ncbi:MAG: DUF3429 family protein [Pseudomonadota bacterium]